MHWQGGVNQNKMFPFSPYVKTDILGKIKLKLIVSGFRLQASRAEKIPQELAYASRILLVETLERHRIL